VIKEEEEEEKVNFCSTIKRKLYSLYFDTGLFQKWQKTSYSKNNNVFNEYKKYNSYQTLQLGLNLSTAKRMTLVSSWNYLTIMQKKTTDNNNEQVI
jgi:hypothetical protein